MKIVVHDGEETVMGPGDFTIIPPGHDAWVVGDEPCVVIDWQGYVETPSGRRSQPSAGATPIGRD